MLTRLDLATTSAGDIPGALPSLMSLPAGGSIGDITGKVAEILSRVREGGDKALMELSGQFDGVVPAQLEVPHEITGNALAAVPAKLVQALTLVYGRLLDYHRHEAAAEGIHLVDSRRDTGTPGNAVHLGDVYVDAGIEVRTWRSPVERAGIYAPGGRARYPSSVLMCAAAARSAGVEHIVLCSPPGHDGLPAPETLSAASIAGIGEIYAVGGAQAIAAMAYGTETVRPVDVIAGPGNVYVSEAKRQVAGITGIPSAFAGPSEVVVIADESANAEWVAADLAVQAEHGPYGMSWLVSWSLPLLERVEEALGRLVSDSPRRADIEATLSGNGYSILVSGLDGAVAVSNTIAPEHLEILSDNAGIVEAMLPRLRSAGAIFIGPYSAAAFGDYLAGPNHVLPTARTARFASALGARDFSKVMHSVHVSAGAAREFAGPVATIAGFEGLPTHALAVQMRLDGAPLSCIPAGESSSASARIRDDLLSFSGYSSPQPRVEVKINANEYPFTVPDKWKEEITSRIASLETNRYPDRRAAGLRAGLGDWIGTDPGNIFIGRGSNEVLQCLLLAYGGHGRGALVFEPTYQMHSRIAAITQTSVHSVMRRDNFDMDMDRVRDAIRSYNPNVIFLCSPNNPTGMLEPMEVVEEVLRLSSGLVILDAAYGEFASDAVLDPAAINCKGRERLVVVRTFSKVWALASMRIGYMIADPSVVQACDLVALPYHIDSISQEVGLVVLGHVGELQDRVNAITHERDRMFARLAGLPVAVWPSQANFLLFRPLDIEPAKLMDALLARSILIRDFSEATGLEGCFRVTVGSREENDRFLAALGETLNGK
ncbi:MAG: histidinol dehydrogenase [Actinobacteria bacterium]|nr:histidinol dehydrogenase [Actinomycetota bacterium]